MLLPSVVKKSDHLVASLACARPLVILIALCYIALGTMSSNLANARAPNIRLGKKIGFLFSLQTTNANDSADQLKSGGLSLSLG